MPPENLPVLPVAPDVTEHDPPQVGLRKSGRRRFILFGLGLLIVLAFAAGVLRVLHKPKDQGPPYMVAYGFDTSVYTREYGLKTIGQHIDWLKVPSLAKITPNIFDAEADSYTYWLLGEDSATHDKYYFAGQATGKDTSNPSYYAFFGDKLVLKLQPDGRAVIYPRMSPSLAHYEFLEPDSNVKSTAIGKNMGYDSGSLDTLSLGAQTTIDTKGFAQGTIPPQQITLKNAIVLTYKGLVGESVPLVLGPIENFSNGTFSKVAVLPQGVLYAQRTKDLMFTSQIITYDLVLPDHTIAHYALRNDYNYPVNDTIKWGHQQNKQSFLSDSTSSRCKLDRHSSDQEVLTVSNPHDLKKIGTYPDGEALYSLASTNSYANGRYNYYKKLLGFSSGKEKLFKGVPRFDTIQQYLAKRPFYLVDSHLGYYYVYSDPSFVYGSSLDCNTK